MITRWFLTAKQKSKGYMTGWGYNGTSSFTKQTALTKGYNTKAEAKAKIDEYINECNNNIQNYKDLLASFIATKTNWVNLSVNEKIEILKHRRNYVENIEYDTDLWNVIYSPSNKTDKFKEVILTKIVWYKDYEQTYNDNINNELNKLKYLNEKIVIRECEIELKFNEHERRKIKWQQRPDDETNGNFCNCCGGAIPSIPQFVIQGGRRYDRGIIICAICMMKLAEEAKKEAGKISPEILEHYEKDRFIRNI